MLLLIFLSLLVLTNLALIGFYAPVEQTMGIVQKIFYYHLSSAWLGMVAFVVVFGASICFLRTRNIKWTIIALASAELGTIFTTLVLITGRLWARSIWNTWWTWDPRLMTTLVMWFMYLAYILLHHSGMVEEQTSRIAAIYGIISFVNVPLVFFSIRWWRSLHPVLITTSSSGLSSEMLITLLVSLFTFLVLYVTLMRIRVRILTLQQQILSISHRRRRG